MEKQIKTVVSQSLFLCYENVEWLEVNNWRGKTKV